jgi:hypothetical protein
MQNFDAETDKFARAGKVIGDFLASSLILAVVVFYGYHLFLR